MTQPAMSRKWFAFLPNLISLARLVLVPVSVDMIASRRWPEALAIFLIAGVSDALDGWVARRFDLRSELGAYLDAVADKALLICDYVTLAIVGVLPMGLALLVVSRDVMIIGAVHAGLAARPPDGDPALVDLQGQYFRANRIRGAGARHAGAQLAGRRMVCHWPMDRRGIDAGLARGLFQALGDAYDGLAIGCHKALLKSPGRRNAADAH